jgi:hypothetical protein
LLPFVILVIAAVMPAFLLIKNLYKSISYAIRKEALAGILHDGPLCARAKCTIDRKPLQYF